MKFDVVIGNPPYNNDMYIPFVEMGYQLASTCSVFITPAKWQAKGGEKNEQFRKNIVPHMSKIVYYLDAHDVFSIGETGGITYYICDKNEHNEKTIINVCNKLSIFNNEDVRPFYKILNNYGYEFIKNKVFKPLFIADLPQQFRYRYRVSKLYSDRNINKHNNVLNPANIEDSKDISILSDNYLIRYSSDNIDNVKSFVSYVNTKYVRFCILIGLCASFIVSNEAWRFVPDPGPFNHIFTDEELYKKYNLTQEEINIIESVIKERK
jgi:site-specific DNA-methyltransferase (adenine-specific)